MDGKVWLAALLGDEMVVRRVRVRAVDMVFVRGILEASEGLGAMFVEPRATRVGNNTAVPTSSIGTIMIAGPISRAVELDETIADLRVELGGALWHDDGEVDE
ncbi:MAG TPA: hypothetical protein VH142_16435 [Polyangiaceae bacterium]|nr:hypothetical protein [Polyangiaceae bacterium]